jgi:hypothetical protein
MRVAIHNPFKKCVAETELSRRIYLAADRIGWKAAEVGCADEINQFAPDFVLSLHFQAAKLTAYPTYGCMWNPPVFFEKEEKYIKNTLSYDAYLVSSGDINRWLNHLLYNTPKQYFTAPFYTSCHQVSYQAPQLEDPRLVYFGVNWDGARFQELFATLDAQSYMEIYGESSGWQYLKQAYRGTLPCDGVSVLHTLNRGGIGLCLHKEQHRQSGIPSMRIFEIVASGAIAICSEHPFITEVFGDCVLSIDSDLSIAETVEQISAHVAWIQSHPQAALEMSKAAHDIFLQHYTLEHLLQGIAAKHEALVQQKGFKRSIQVMGERSPSQPQPSVQIIVRSDQNWQALQRTLDSVLAQTYQPVSVILLLENVNSEIESRLQPYQDQLLIERIESQSVKYRSADLWKALKLVNSDYFAILHSGEVLFPNHLSVLCQLLHQFPEVGVAYSGAVHRVVVTHDPKRTVREPMRLNSFQNFELSELLSFNSFIAANSFVARSNLIQHLNSQDPQLQLTDELYLLLYFAAIAQFIFSYEITCECHPKSRLDSSEKQIWEQEVSELKYLLSHTELAPGSPRLTYQTQVDWLNFQAEMKRLRAEMKRSQAQLEAAQEAIAAMESSKFWQLRAGWFRIKQFIGLGSD